MLMLRGALIAAVLCLAGCEGCESDDKRSSESAGQGGSGRHAEAGSTSQPPPPQGCCRMCTTGKACGDTCIAKSLTCRAGVGCACNAFLVDYTADADAGPSLTGGAGY